MRSLWKFCLALSLGGLATVASAQEGVWRPVKPAPAGQPAGQPIASTQPLTQAQPVAPASPVAELGKPVVVAQPRTDPATTPVVFRAVTPGAPVVRGAAPDSAIPMPPGQAASANVAGLHSWRRPDEPIQPKVGPGVAPPTPLPAPTPFSPAPQSSPVVNSVPDAPAAPGLIYSPAVPASIHAPGIAVPTMVAPGHDPCPPVCTGGTCGAPGFGLGGLGCFNDCCPPGNIWYVGAEYLLWGMKGDSTPPLVTGGPASTALPNVGVLGQPGTQVLFGGTGLGDDFTSGARLTAGMWFSQAHYWGVEMSGFYLGSVNDGFSASSLGGTVLARPIIDLRPFVVNNAGQTVANPAFGQESRERVADPGLAGSIDVDRQSRFWGGEVNLRRGLLCCENGYIDLLFGGRILGLDEELTITERLVTLGTETPTRFTVQDRFKTTNRFYGGQIGFDSEWRRGCWSLGVRGKIGMGTTQQTAELVGLTTAQQGTGAIQTGAGGLLVLNGTNQGTHYRELFTVVPEVGVTLGYQVCSWCRATVGYNFLYWSNVIRPGGVIDRGVNATYQPFSPISPTFVQNGVAAGVPARPAVFNGSDFWAQGLTLGLEFRW